MGLTKKQDDWWGQAPLDWALLMEPNHYPLYEVMLEVAKVSKNTSILDAGCGGGGACVLAAKQGAKVSGLDSSEGLINIARNRVPTGDIRVGDIQKLPFENDVFQAVIAANSVQFAGNPVAAVRELGRVCAPNGRVVVGLFASPERVEYRRVFEALRDVMSEPPSDDGPFGFSAPGKLETLIEDAGLHILESNEVNCPFSFSNFEAFWKAATSAGPIQMAIHSFGEDKLKAVLQTTAEAFRVSDGSIKISPNIFKYIVAVP